MKHAGPELGILCELVEHGSTVVDVGAHVGAYTYALCRCVGAEGQVIAVEPIPELANLLRRATTRLRLPVTVAECALSSQEGEAELLIPLDNGVRRPGMATLEKHSAAGFRERVRLRRLDELCRNVRGRVSFMKIDVEGHELAVLRGSIGTLQQDRPNLFVEIEQRHSPVPITETFGFLTALGYSGEFLDRDGMLRPLSSFDVEEHQTRHLQDIGTPAYINNFVFRSHS
jgi:FkbM family methyltransferase